MNAIKSTVSKRHKPKLFIFSTPSQATNWVRDRFDPKTTKNMEKSMNIKELKEKIADLSDEMMVFIDERLTDEEFKYGLVNSAEVKAIPFSESEGHEVLAEDDCFILSEA